MSVQNGTATCLLYDSSLPEEVGCMHVHTKNILREPIGYNTKVDTEGIAGAR